MWISGKEDRELVSLCSQATLAELHSLVEELHRQRTANGIDLADYELQARLKALIYSVYRHGDLTRGPGQANRSLLAQLKQASLKLEGLKPTGILREVLRNLSASWPQLMTMFWAFLAMPGVDTFMGEDLPLARNYLQFNRFLYFLFLTRLAQLGQGFGNPERFLFEDAQIRGQSRGMPELTRAYRQLRSGERRDWVGGVPLLPVSKEQWLLSPELLHDDLLENYARLLNAYAHRSEQDLVAEGRIKKPPFNYS